MNFVSTGKASKLFSVTPDTVLKWIKQNKLPANKTAGGHYRISLEVISSFLQFQEKKTLHLDRVSEKLMHCWEFFAENRKVKLGCTSCLVFRAQALKCFEMHHIPQNMGFKGGISASSCKSCAYYNYHEARPFKVLVITDNPACKEHLTRQPESPRMQLHFVSCEYDSSLVVDWFRPDFVVVDCTMQQAKCQELCHHLSTDPRIPNTTIILATPPRRQALSFPGAIRIRHPISLNELETHLNRMRGCYLNQNLQR